ncbi:anti-sigma factor family protein [Vallitalea okinawensis]|uniref:anti-sigma factor family protein n=1 Tax=Vallitalea okinawensis TaxID=2078660 RepID=UPI0013003322|nr:zf-HC2 domain-containing protein [Vallitalea okinawensis]
MNCNEIRDLISLYIDDELNTTEQIQFEEHIASCEACKYELEMLKEIVGTLNETEITPLPNDFHEDLMEKIHEIERENHEIKEQNNKFVSFLSQLFKKKFMVPAVSIACIMLLLVVARNPLIMNDGLMVEKAEKSTNKMAAYDTAALEESAEESKADNKSDMPMAASETTNAASMKNESKEDIHVDSEEASIEEIQVAGETELTLTFGDTEASPEFSEMYGAADKIIDEFSTYEEIFTHIVNDLSELEATAIQLSSLKETNQLDEKALIDNLRFQFGQMNFYSSTELPQEDFYSIVVIQEETSDGITVILQVLNEEFDLYKEYNVEAQESGMMLREIIESE